MTIICVRSYFSYRCRRIFVTIGLMLVFTRLKPMGMQGHFLNGKKSNRLIVKFECSIVMIKFRSYRTINYYLAISAVTHQGRQSKRHQFFHSSYIYISQRDQTKYCAFQSYFRKKYP